MMRYLWLLALLVACAGGPTEPTCLTADPDKNPELFTKIPLYDQIGNLVGYAYVCATH